MLAFREKQQFSYTARMRDAHRSLTASRTTSAAVLWCAD
jgi:hypothetical protein